jgi:DNA-binding LytR/AlgR family response regulator
MEGEIRILIVEDEFMISEDISMRLTDFGYKVSGIASSANEALTILKQGQTDLALLDINIDGPMDGIELASIIHNQYSIPFIFLTSLASNSIVEKAKKTQPSAYLLKPFNDRQVQIAIEMALINYSKQLTPVSVEPDGQHRLNDEAVVIDDSFFIRKDSCYVKILIDDIDYLSAEGSYTMIYTDKNNYLHCQVLKYFEKLLPPKKFMRIHRSHIINIASITKIEGNTLKIGSKVLPLGKSYRDNLFKVLNII